MLYLSTRSKTDSFTSNRALRQTNPPEGGHFLPFRISPWDTRELQRLKNCSFGDNIAAVVNYFFATKLTGWDIDCLIGRNFATVTAMSRKVFYCSICRGTSGSFDDTIQRIYARLVEQEQIRPGAWPLIAIRIAALFGIAAHSSKLGADRFDISVICGDFSWPMAAWYARQMGLPVGTVICACNENSGIWDLLHRGQMDLSAPVRSTGYPLMDIAVPEYMEYLIRQTLGAQEVMRFLQAKQEGKTYFLEEEDRKKLCDGLFVSVVGKRRLEPVINSVYRSGGVVLDPYCAASYGALQDYRAKSGENRATLLVGAVSPRLYPQQVCNATGLTAEELNKTI